MSEAGLARMLRQGNLDALEELRSAGLGSGCDFDVEPLTRQSQRLVLRKTPIGMAESVAGLARLHHVNVEVYTGSDGTFAVSAGGLEHDIKDFLAGIDAILAADSALQRPRVKSPATRS